MKNDVTESAVQLKPHFLATEPNSRMPNILIVNRVHVHRRYCEGSPGHTCAERSTLLGGSIVQRLEF